MGLLPVLALACSVVWACNQSAIPLAPGPDLATADLTEFTFAEDGPRTTDDMGDVPLNACGDHNVACHDVAFGPDDTHFALATDPMRDPSEKDHSVARDADGFLGLDTYQISNFYHYLWIANAAENTLSVLDSRKIRELARYSTVTCFSNKTGSKAACDGTNGCCTKDDDGRWQARKNKQNQPAHQAVQTTANFPSRTAVDLNGDLFISNRAFGGQSSVTKIASDRSGCIDRNKNGVIDSSSDVNGDGQIAIDCNGNSIPDDLEDVKAAPCNNGMKQEYYGHDDECILWTTNTFVNNAVGRPLALGNGTTAANDAWAGSYQNSNFVRIDGATGLVKDEAQLEKQCLPYGATIDAQGIAWTTPHGGGKLCYFDTNKSTNVGKARDANFGEANGYGITMDRDQNIWIGSGIQRYTPDRSNGFANLGSGSWMQVKGPFGIGIAADSRNSKDYFVYSCNGSSVLQIPASTLPSMKVDRQVDSAGWPTINMPCYGVGVDLDQNIWGVSQSIATKALVDKNGVITQPKINTPPIGINVCPAGDQCPMSGGPYTYSDFTGFGLRNFTVPSGSWSIVVSGCDSGLGQGPSDTEWHFLDWDALLPPNTSIAVRARSGNKPLPDETWGAWTVSSMRQPFDLRGGVLEPNLYDQMSDAYLQIEVTFKSSASTMSPKLKHLDVSFECPTQG